MIGDVYEERRGVNGFGQAAPFQTTGSLDFTRRMWREGVRPRDPQIRELWRQFRRHSFTARSTRRLRSVLVIPPAPSRLKFWPWPKES